MKIACAVLAMSAVSSALPVRYIEENEMLLWDNFKNTYGKKYSEADEVKRRAIFKSNLMKGAEQEAANPRATFGINIFSDLSTEEFKSYHSLRVPTRTSPPKQFTDADVAAVGDAIDWRSKGAVTNVKSQMECGSNWAFSATGSIEGLWFIAGHNLTSVSEQQLVSCDTKDMGCNGGLMDNAWEWLVSARSGQIVTEASYPYTSGEGVSGTCRDVSNMTVGGVISGHRDIAHDEDEMAAFVYNNGPLSIAVDATSWQTYSGGVMTNCKSVALDHGALIVGYAADYWIIKNAWGTGWGEAGYIRVQKGTNQCLIKNSPCTAEVSSH